MLKSNRNCPENMTATATMDGQMGSMNMEMNYGNYAMPYGGCCPMDPCPQMCPPIYECPQERVCHRMINYEVPQECQFLIDQVI